MGLDVQPRAAASESGYLHPVCSCHWVLILTDADDESAEIVPIAVEVTVGGDPSASLSRVVTERTERPWSTAIMWIGNSIAVPFEDALGTRTRRELSPHLDRKGGCHTTGASLKSRRQGDARGRSVTMRLEGVSDMGVTVDLIPLLSGESPEDAIARIYDGGMEIVIDVEEQTGTVEEIVNDVEPAPAGAFDEWRAEVLRRLYELFPDWSSEEDDGLPVLWTSGCEWQVEFKPNEVMLRARGGVPRGPGPGLDDLCGIFAGLRTIIHWPHNGSYTDLDDPDDLHAQRR
ncbi:MAG: hypothetical protein JST64_03665 [Actinobacteria bacterium]|nr:hypothetical protein [Actinomycetota bacterium]